MTWHYAFPFCLCGGADIMACTFGTFCVDFSLPVYEAYIRSVNDDRSGQTSVEVETMLEKLK